MRESAVMCSWSHMQAVHTRAWSAATSSVGMEWWAWWFTLATSTGSSSFASSASMLRREPSGSFGLSEKSPAV